jgi:hypothetical protein
MRPALDSICSTEEGEGGGMEGKRKSRKNRLLDCLLISSMNPLRLALSLMHPGGQGFPVFYQ